MRHLLTHTPSLNSRFIEMRREYMKIIKLKKPEDVEKLAEELYEIFGE